MDEDDSPTSSMSVSVNSFSVKYYGSVKKVEMERRRQERAGRFIIHPHSRFRFFWDVITLFLLIISMLIVPIAITFFSDVISKDPGWLAFNGFMDVWFILDIMLNFHTGYIKDSGEGDIVLNPKEIRKHYVKTWFLIDLLSAIPFDYILNATSINTPSVAASRAVKLFRFAKVASLLRLLRISRLIRYVHQWEQVVGLQYDLAVAAVRVFNLVCLILLIGHWNGCLQFLVPMLNDFPNDSWIVVDRLMNTSWSEQYSWCLFKAMSHMVCIGYGQQPPKNMTDLWMTMLSMMSGAVCFAMFIGHITALIQSMDTSERQYKEKYTQVKEYMRYRRLPVGLRNRVFKYYEHRFQGKLFDERGILHELSIPLREDVINFNCRHLVSAVPFFKNAEADFVTEVVQKLNFQVFQPEDVIVKEGTVGRTMYFIQQGVVEVRKADAESPIKRLADGSFFGEICLLVNGRRVASVVAISYCHTYSLHAEDLNAILSDHPVMKKALEQVAADRLKHIGHKNDVLDERLKETNDCYSQATSLAAEIAKHDQTSSKVVKRNNEYFQPLKSQPTQLQRDGLQPLPAENTKEALQEPKRSRTYEQLRKYLNKSYSNIGQQQITSSMASETDGACNQSPSEKKKDLSCIRIWGSPCRFTNRSRSKSLSLRPFKLPKIKGNPKSPTAKHNPPTCSTNLSGEHSNFPKNLFQHRQNNETESDEMGGSDLHGEGHIVVHMQDHASPYADFTAYMSSQSLDLSDNSSQSIDQSASQESHPGPTNDDKKSASFNDIITVSNDVTAASISLDKQVMSNEREPKV